jgi:hypothetical protein
MASLRATKKSNSASNMSEDIHARTSRKQVDNDLEDTGASDAMDAAEDGSDQEQAQSQSKSARELLSNMVAGVSSWLSWVRVFAAIWYWLPAQARKRHTAKKKNVIVSHARTAKNVETSIDNLFDEHETKSWVMNGTHYPYTRRFSDAHSATTIVAFLTLIALQALRARSPTQAPPATPQAQGQAWGSNGSQAGSAARELQRPFPRSGECSERPDQGVEKWNQHLTFACCMGWRHIWTKWTITVSPRAKVQVAQTKQQARINANMVETRMDNASTLSRIMARLKVSSVRLNSKATSISIPKHSTHSIHKPHYMHKPFHKKLTRYTSLLFNSFLPHTKLGIIKTKNSKIALSKRPLQKKYPLMQLQHLA